MPYGLTYAPATCQWLMESCLGELHLNWCIIYLDDIIVFSRTMEEHIHWLKAVISKLRAADLKLKPTKCDLFRQQINYLGHVVSKEGVSTDPDKIKAVIEWPQPTTVTQVRSFLGFVRYYRRFIPNFSKVARPLNKLLQTLEGMPSQKKGFNVCWDQNNRKLLKHCKGCARNPPSWSMQTLRLPLYSIWMPVGMDWMQYCTRSRRDKRESLHMPQEVCPKKKNKRNYPV